MLLIDDRKWWWIEVNASDQLWLLWLHYSFSVSFSVTAFLLSLNSIGVEPFSLLPILFGLTDDLLLTGELMVFIIAQVVVSQKLADSQSDLSLGPIWEELLSDKFVLSGTELDDTFNQQLCLFLLAPVVALFNVEVFQIQRSIREADVVLAERLSHGDDVFHLGLIEDVVGRTNVLGLAFDFGQQMLLRNLHGFLI